MAQVVQWLGSKMFKFVHQNNLIYNTCWEDPRLDRQALQITSQDRIMMITSAGCNALDYALLQPQKIYAIDVNPKQNALLELKIAGIQNLEYKDFFSLFGQGKHENFSDLYAKHLRPALSHRSQVIWDSQQGYFQETRWRPSFYFRGTSGTIARMFNSYINLKNLRNKVDLIFEASSLQEQSDLYFAHFKENIWSPFVKWLISTDVALSLVGVPRAQRNQIDQNYPGGIAAFIEDCIESVFTRLSLKDNYFWWLYLNGEYSKNRCPEYLKEEQFHLLKSTVHDRIEVHTTTILDFLQSHHGTISKYVLLDHMDWLSAHHNEVLKQEWQEMINHASLAAKFIWRSGGLSSEFIDRIEISQNGKSQTVADVLQYNRQMAQDLHKKDRVHTYGSFYIANFAPGFAE